MHTLWCLAALLAMGTLAGCKKEDDGPQPVPPGVPEKLSEYGFFTGELKYLQPAERVMPYELNTPLFTDYAFKARFAYIPEGSSASYSASGVFSFPEGSVLIKNFYYPLDFRQPDGPRRLVETRLLVRTASGWEARNYVWNAAQTEATRNTVGGLAPQTWIHTDGSTRTAQYWIPNQNQCQGCHSLNNQLVPIGPSARNLNRSYAYTSGSANQLDFWSGQGFLTGAPAANLAPRLADAFDAASGSLEERARAYLDVNCAHCHQPEGPASNSGLVLTAHETDPEKLGFCKTTVAAGQGSGGLPYSIYPAKPDSSIIPYRMNSTNPAVMMPELGRSVVHSEGVQLIRDWIASLDPNACN